jgi:uncharacterized protein (DUF433 family)
MVGTQMISAMALREPIGAYSGINIGNLMPTSWSSGRTFNVSNANYERIVASGTPRFPYLGCYVTTDRDFQFSVTVTSVSDPLIVGTDIPIYRISALLAGGLSVDEILKDFPSLSREQIESARIFSSLHTANRYPSMSLKRLLRDSGMYELDQELKELRKKARGGGSLVGSARGLSCTY